MMEITIKQVTPEQWASAERHGYTGKLDGQPAMLYLDRKTQATVYGQVELRTLAYRAVPWHTKSVPGG